MGPARLMVGRHFKHGASRTGREAVRGVSDGRHGWAMPEAEDAGAVTGKDGAGTCRAFRVFWKDGCGPPASLGVPNRRHPLRPLGQGAFRVWRFQQEHGPFSRRAFAMKMQVPFFLPAERETHQPGLHALKIAGRAAPLAHSRRTQRQRSAVREAVRGLADEEAHGPRPGGSPRVRRGHGIGPAAPGATSSSHLSPATRDSELAFAMGRMIDQRKVRRFRVRTFAMIPTPRPDHHS